mmetsp:Transcript_2291/g.3187  ORF Transcript_2291/g.3187 Transcript_2291/m.3187 type:complete len:221 (+) Transcript_2291:149-811(+)
MSETPERKYKKGPLPAWLFEIEDEPQEHQQSIVEELDIDFREILKKVLWVVLFPLIPSRHHARCMELLRFHETRHRLQQRILVEAPDFWGPLFTVIAYATLLLWGKFKVVPWVILIWICGAYLLHFLAQGSGLDHDFSQCLAVMGYSLAPLMLTIFLAVLCRPGSLFLMLIQAVGVLWSTRSALGSLVPDPNIHQSRQWILIYPTLLFYLYLVSLYAPPT